MGLDIKKDTIKAFEGDCISELQTCYFEGCVLIIELIKRGFVITDLGKERDTGEEQREVLKEIQNTAHSLDAARASLDQKLESVTQQVVALQKEIKTVKDAPSAALEAQETKQGASRCVLLAGSEVQGSRAGP